MAAQTWNYVLGTVEPSSLPLSLIAVSKWAFLKVFSDCAMLGGCCCISVVRDRNSKVWHTVFSVLSTFETALGKEDSTSHLTGIPLRMNHDPHSRISPFKTFLNVWSPSPRCLPKWSHVLCWPGCGIWFTPRLEEYRKLQGCTKSWLWVLQKPQVLFWQWKPGVIWVYEQLVLHRLSNCLRLYDQKQSGPFTSDASGKKK